MEQCDYILNFDLEKIIKEYFDINKERKRNLLINLTKYLIKNNKKIDSILTYKEIRENILIKEFDFLVYKDFLFNENYLKFEIKQYYRDWINMIIVKRNSLKYYIDKEDEFKILYLKLKNLLVPGNYNNKLFNEYIKKCSKLAYEIHWKHLPILSEKIIKDIGYLPEDNVESFYENYHSLKELYDCIIGNNVEFKKLNGDNTLNQPLDFDIYSSKNNSYTKYTIFRTIYGWKINDIESFKNGKNILKYLKNNNIFSLPEEGICFAFEKIWNLADNGYLSLEELKNKIQDIAIWISDVEKIIKNKKPKWCDEF